MLIENHFNSDLTKIVNKPSFSYFQWRGTNFRYTFASDRFKVALEADLT